MLRRSLTYITVLICAFTLFAGSCGARPAIDKSTILQICDAFGMKSAERMPSFISPEAIVDLFKTYSRYSEQLQGCLSATERRRTSDTVTFLVQNTRYESYWSLYGDDQAIRKISIERFRPVTLADDEPWETPSAAVLREGRISFDLPVGGNKGVRAGAWRLGKPISKETHHTAHRIEKTDQETGNSIEKQIKDVGSNRNVVEFFYATNRKESDTPPNLEGSLQPTSTDNGVSFYSSNGWRAVSGYTGERAPQLSLGIIRVRVPEGHHIGSIELPSDHKLFWFTLWRDTLDQAKHFTIRSIEATDEQNWLQTLASTGRKKALVFVHGFNTKFRDAVFRAAQITWDLQFKGTTVLFSWPSRGNVADYLYDKDSALGSRSALLHVIDDLHKAGFDDIDVIAHSMGNLIAVDALANSGSTRSPTTIAQLIMAAPDVDRDMFVQDIPGVEKVTKGLTLYASKNDKALQLSKRIAGDIPRAGDVPATGPIVLPGVWTIDVSAIGDELFGLNHNTFAATRNVLNDLSILLDRGTPPPRLAEIHGYPEPPQKPTYFRYVP